MDGLSSEKLEENLIFDNKILVWEKPEKNRRCLNYPKCKITQYSRVLHLSHTYYLLSLLGVP